MPWVVPLCCLALYSNAMLIHLMVSEYHVKLTDDGKISQATLWQSLMLGYGLLAWVYVSCELNGRWLVVGGMPLMSGQP